MSFTPTYRKFQSMSALALQIRDEGNAIIRTIARRESAKVIALDAYISPRHVYNLREEVGQPDLGWPHFILMARKYPELRGKVLEWLNADRDPSLIANEIIQFINERTK